MSRSTRARPPLSFPVRSLLLVTVGSVCSGWTYLRALLWCRVQRPAKIPAFTPGFLCFSLILLHGSFVHHTSKVQQLTAHRGLAGIDMTNENNIEMLLGCVLT